MEDEAVETKPSRRRVLWGGLLAAAAMGVPGVAAAAPRAPRERSLHLASPHTGEVFRDVYWENGRYRKPALRRLSWLMRDVRTDRARAIDTDLLDLLHGIGLRLKPRQPIYVLSGYRSPETNAALREEGYAPVENSLHLAGAAADIHVPGVSLRYVTKAALSFQAGGVGTYWQNNFVHVDTGRVRTW